MGVSFSDSVLCGAWTCPYSPLGTCTYLYLQKDLRPNMFLEEMMGCLTCTSECSGGISISLLTQGSQWTYFIGVCQTRENVVSWRRNTLPRGPSTFRFHVCPSTFEGPCVWSRTWPVSVHFGVSLRFSERLLRILRSFGVPSAVLVRPQPVSDLTPSAPRVPGSHIM